MNILDTVQTIAKLAKASMNLEFQEKIAELREQVVMLKEDHARLRAENLRLLQELEYFTKGDSCPKCKQPSWILEGSRPHPIFGDLGALERTYKCKKCGHTENRFDEGGRNG